MLLPVRRALLPLAALTLVASGCSTAEPRAADPVGGTGSAGVVRENSSALTGDGTSPAEEPADAQATSGDEVLGAQARRSFVVNRTGDSYRASAQPGSRVYRGTLKQVMERSAADLQRRGGGVVRFTAGTFDFGSGYYLGVDVRNVAFVGAGMRRTTLRNSSNADADTEPFNFTGAFRVTIRDLTVRAGGSERETSDALDFDNGSQVTVKRVRVLDSRGRGIVFDGKDAGASAANNLVSGCVVRSVPGNGIELLATTESVVEKCRINRVGRTGIALIKSSPSASQANKKPNRNVIRRNRVNQSGEHGILVISGDRNRIIRNTVKNSSDKVVRRDGIRVDTQDSVRCDRNKIRRNTATDTQRPKTQFYGVHITQPACHRNQVVRNKLGGNLTAPFRDGGTGTVIRR